MRTDSMKNVTMQSSTKIVAALLASTMSLVMNTTTFAQSKRGGRDPPTLNRKNQTHDRARTQITTNRRQLPLAR